MKKNLPSKLVVAENDKDVTGQDEMVAGKDEAAEKEKAVTDVVASEAIMNPFKIPVIQRDLLPTILKHLDNKSLCQLRETWNKVIWVDKFPREESFYNFIF